MSYITDQELLRLIQAARLPADVAIRLGTLLRTAGTPGPAGADGAAGAAGPAPSGTGFVTVTGGVLDTPQTPTQVTGVLDTFTSGAKGLTPLSGGGTANFLRADGSWVLPPNSIAGNYTTLVKSTNQDVTNSTTLVDDTDLQFSVIAGNIYSVYAILLVSGSNSGNDIRVSLNVSAGTMSGRGFAHYLNATLTPTFGVTQATASATVGTFSVGTESDIDYPHVMTFWFPFRHNTTNGTFRVQFANLVAGSGIISRILAGSTLTYAQLN